MKKTVCILTIFVSLCIALIPPKAEAQVSKDKTMMGLRRGVAVVMFAGLAGAVLGASTLSFYGEPQEHVNNIWTGLAVGALLGGGYVLSQGQDSLMTKIANRPTNPNQVARTSPSLWQYQIDF